MTRFRAAKAGTDFSNACFVCVVLVSVVEHLIFFCMCVTHSYILRMRFNLRRRNCDADLLAICITVLTKHLTNLICVMSSLIIDHSLNTHVNIL